MCRRQRHSLFYTGRKRFGGLGEAELPICYHRRSSVTVKLRDRFLTKQTILPVSLHLLPIPLSTSHYKSHVYLQVYGKLTDHKSVCHVIVFTAWMNTLMISCALDDSISFHGIETHSHGLPCGSNWVYTVVVPIVCSLPVQDAQSSVCLIVWSQEQCVGHTSH